MGSMLPWTAVMVLTEPLTERTRGPDVCETWDHFLGSSLSWAVELLAREGDNSWHVHRDLFRRAYPYGTSTPSRLQCISWYRFYGLTLSLIFTQTTFMSI